jgi:hypothetical protein
VNGFANGWLVKGKGEYATPGLLDASLGNPIYYGRHPAPSEVFVIFLPTGCLAHRSSSGHKHSNLESFSSLRETTHQRTVMSQEPIRPDIISRA